MEVLLTSYYYQPHFGGVENSLRHLAAEYQYLGHNVRLLVSDRGVTGSRLPSRETKAGVEIHRFPAAARISVAAGWGWRRDVQAARRVIAELHAERRIDRVIARHHVPALAVMEALPQAGLTYLAPGVALYQDRPARESRLAGAGGWLRWLHARYINWPQAHRLQAQVVRSGCDVAVFSQNMANQMAAAFGPGVVRTRQVRPGVDSRRFSPAEDKRVLRRTLKLPEETFLFLIIGRMTRAKGFRHAIEAAAQLRYAGIDSHVVAVGDGPEVSSLRALAATRGVDDRIVWVGRSTAPEQYFAAVDAMLMTSDYEPFGQTILEAMASGLPVVAFRGESVVTASEEILPPDYPWLCHPGSDALAVAMQGLCGLAVVDRENLGAQLRHHALAHYSWRKLALDLLDVPSEAA